MQEIEFLHMVKDWDKLPVELVNVPFPETFKVRLDWDLSNLIWLKMPLWSLQRELDKLTFKGPIQPKIFCDSKTYFFYCHVLHFFMVEEIYFACPQKFPLKFTIEDDLPEILPSMLCFEKCAGLLVCWSPQFS